MVNNRSKMAGEEVFLRGLYELVSGISKHRIAEETFGRDWTQQCRAFSWFIKHIFLTKKHLIIRDLDLPLEQTNLGWWYRNGFFERSRLAIFSKMRSVSPDLDEDLCGISHFIDCNCESTSRPGGGPAEEGTDATRHDDLVQRAFYNGWKSVFGLKTQTVDNAFGMTVDMYGPVSLRRNDLALFRDSEINDCFAELQTGNPVQCRIFGDSAYKTPMSHVNTYLSRSDMPNAAKLYNYALKSVRISIEWNYGFTSNLFKYFQNFDKLRLLGSNTVTMTYVVATLFRNFYICLYGGQTSNYFNINIENPSLFLEKYMTLSDL